MPTIVYKFVIHFYFSKRNESNKKLQWHTNREWKNSTGIWIVSQNILIFQKSAGQSRNSIWEEYISSWYSQVLFSHFKIYKFV